MATMTLTLVFSDGKRIHVRDAEAVPREGDHALVMGAYYRVESVVWQFASEMQHGSAVSIAAIDVCVHQHGVVKPVDGVVQGCAMNADLHTFRGCQRLIVKKSYLRTRHDTFAVRRHDGLA
jgi:hypothetical protein